MILVTGANGKTGSEVVRQLAASGSRVRAMVRDRAKAAMLPKANVEIVEGSFAEPASLDSAMKGIDAVFLISFEHPEQLRLQNNVIAAAKRAGVRTIARMSASSADVDADDPLVRTHGEGDRQLAQSGLAYVLIRPHWFSQNFLTFCPGGLIRLPAGTARLPFVDVRDIAAVTIKALTAPEHDGKAYVLTGPEALDHAQVASILSEETGKRFVYEDAAPEAYRQELIAKGATEFYADRVTRLFESVRKRGTTEVHDDVPRVLGRPAIPFRQFARDFSRELARQVG